MDWLLDDADLSDALFVKTYKGGCFLRMPYLLWGRLPDGVDQSIWVRFLLLLARLSALGMPLGFLWFFVSIFVHVSS